MRRLLPLVLALVLAGPAAAAVIRGTARGDVVRGTERPDRIVAGGGNDRIDVAFGGRDTVSCGAGRDVVSADRTDVVSSDCEIVSRRISADTSRNSESQHESAVEPDSFAFGPTVVATFQLGRFETGAASNIGWATSLDAGRTWRSGVLPGVTEESKPPGSRPRASDPAVAYDAEHGTWLIVSLAVSIPRPGAAMLVSRSTDGVRWQLPVETFRAASLDKEWIACDNGATSPFRGRCYLVFRDLDRNRTVVQTSADGGATWSAATRIGIDTVGLQPVVRPDGSLVVVTVDFDERGDRGRVISYRSPDGGVTWQGPTNIAAINWHATSGVRALPLPSVEADAAGTVYAVWHDCSLRATCSTNDLVLARSSDGVTWSPPARIPAPGDDRFITGLGADPSAVGRIAVVYAFFRPSSCKGAACTIQIGVVSSGDGGTTWSPPDVPAPLAIPRSWFPRASLDERIRGAMLGDYFSLSYANGRAVPVFALASAPRGKQLRQGVFATSLAVRPQSSRKRS